MGIQLRITAFGGPFCAHTSESFPQAFSHSWNGVCSHCRTGEDFDSQIEHIICKRLSSQVIFLSFLQAICTFAELGPLTCRQLFRPGISLSPYLSASPPPLGDHRDCGGVRATMDACANPSPQHRGWRLTGVPDPITSRSRVLWCGHLSS